MAFKNISLEDLAHLPQMPLSSAFLLSGNSSFLRDEFITLLKKRVVNPQSADFNVDEFNARMLDKTEMYTAAKSFPVSSEYRLIIIDELEKACEEILGVLRKLIETPEKSVIIVLIAESETHFRFLKGIDENRHKAYKLSDPYESQLYKWIVYIAKKYKKKISTRAIDFLRINVGPHLSRLDKEIEKIASFLQNKDLIDIKDIERVIPNSKTISIFEFTDVLGQKDLKGSLVYLNKLLLDQKEVPLYILTMMYRHFYKLYLGRLYQEEGMSPHDMCTTLKINPYFQKKFLNVLNNFSRERIERIFNELAYIDSKLKTSKMKAEVLLKNVVRTICAV